MPYKKSEISKEFNLREYNFLVFNFQNPRAKYRNEKGFTDIVLIDKIKPVIIFIEIKTISTKDKLNDNQVIIKEVLESISKENRSIRYFIADENNFKELASRIKYRDYKNI